VDLGSKTISFLRGAAHAANKASESPPSWLSSPQGSAVGEAFESRRGYSDTCLSVLFCERISLLLYLITPR
jgi:hypothetical protein